MFTFCIVVILIAAVLMVLVVLVQNSKGGGLASNFASGNQVMGAPKTADFLEKVTWVLASIIVLFSIIGVGVDKHQKSEEQAGSVVSRELQNAMGAQQNAAPSFEENETPASSETPQ